MIRPDKYVPVEQSIVGLGAVLLQLLRKPSAQFTLWSEFRAQDQTETFARFVAALDFLFAAGLIRQTAQFDKLERAR